MYVLPHGVGILRLFCLRTGLIHFAHFGLQSRMVFEGTTGEYERIYHVNSKWVRKKEKHANSKWIWGMFCLCSYLSNDSNFCPQARSKMGMDCRSLVWKRSWKITFFGPKSRQDLKNQLAHPHQEFPGVPPGYSHRVMGSINGLFKKVPPRYIWHCNLWKAHVILSFKLENR